jgi:ABC-type Fe2+-enterobactin transport system substrate-binding protein
MIAYQAMKFYTVALLLHFETNQPAEVVLECDGKTYYHQTKDLGLARSHETEAAKARDQRNITVVEVRDLLKNPMMLHAKQDNETKVLVSLNNATYKFSLSVRKG